MKKKRNKTLPSFYALIANPKERGQVAQNVKNMATRTSYGNVATVANSQCGSAGAQRISANLAISMQEETVTKNATPKSAQ